MVDILHVANASTTASANLAAQGVSDAEGWLPSTVNNFTRASWAILSGFYDDLGGVNTVGGTANAITITGGIPATALATGDLIAFKNTGGPNTAATTLNRDGLGAKAIRLQGDTALVGGELLDDGTYLLKYDAAYNAAAGAWVVFNPGPTGKGADVASATTTSLGGGDFFHITGTTTITDIDFTTPRDGRGAWLEFDGILTLTYNATTLNLPGAANITTAAGDRAYIVQDSGDNVHVLAYVRAAVAPLNSSGWIAATPTFTAFGTVTAISIFTKRDGDTLRIRGAFTSGTPTASEARMSLLHNGVSLTVDATKAPVRSLAGITTFGSSGPFSGYLMCSTGDGFVTFGIQQATTSGQGKANGTDLTILNTVVNVLAEVPITGW